MKGKKKSMFYQEEANRNSHIVSRVTKNGKLRTETAGRDRGSDRFAVSTDDNNSTKLFLDFEGGDIRGGETLQLSGRQARTLYRLLNAHYNFTGK